MTTRILRVILTLLALLQLAACTLPVRPDLPRTVAITDPQTTPLGQMLAPRLAENGDSSFRLLPVASVAFDTRIALTEVATRTIDLQYYIFSADDTGKRLLRALSAAARRGVRVRLLIDDFYSTGEDHLLAEFASQPNVEVRLFNPFAGGRSSTLGRLLGASFDLERINRRMHNKLFIVDNAAAMAGGRNIANEYFMHSASSNFVDLDLFVAGPAVPQLSAAFDRYWNSPMVYPINVLTTMPTDLHAARADFDAQVAAAQGPPPDELPPELAYLGTLPSELRRHQVGPLSHGHITVLADNPEKAVMIEAGRLYEPGNFTRASLDAHPEDTVTLAVLDRMSHAEHEVDIISPYFVPGERGLQMMRDATASGGVVHVYTNSLASTDAPMAEEGYIRYRERMIDEGVEVYELSPHLARDRRHFGPFGRSLGSLHAKLVIIDDRTVFMGSMNLDHRSAVTNTEVGLLIDSTDLAAQIASLTDRGSFYRVSRDAQGRLRWTADGPNGPEVFYADPETSWWDRVEPMLTEPFVPEGDL